MQMIISDSLYSHSQMNLIHFKREILAPVLINNFCNSGITFLSSSLGSIFHYVLNFKHLQLVKQNIGYSQGPVYFVFLNMLFRLPFITCRIIKVYSNW